MDADHRQGPGGHRSRMGAAVTAGVRSLRGPRPDHEAAGVRAWATVNSVTPTGRRYGYRPELRIEVTVEGRERVFDVSVIKAVTEAQLAQLQPGARIPCRFDPGDPASVVL